MKNRLYILVAFVLLSSFTLAQTTSKKEIKKTCAEFNTAIVNQNQQFALSYFDKEYKETQHDGFLEGRTEQFLQEFLAGQAKGDVIYTTPKLEDVKSVKLKKIQFTKDGEAEAELNVKLKNGKLLKSSVLIIIKSEKDIYFVGAMG